MINRRDILKAIIGMVSVGALSKMTEVQAAPEVPSVEPKIQPRYIPPYVGVGSITVYGQSGTWAQVGTEIVHRDPVPSGFALWPTELLELNNWHKLGYPYFAWSPNPTYGIQGTGTPGDELNNARRWAQEQGFA